MSVSVKINFHHIMELLLHQNLSLFLSPPPPPPLSLSLSLSRKTNQKTEKDPEEEKEDRVGERRGGAESEESEPFNIQGDEEIGRGGEE